jgi:ribonuclease P protein component
MTRAASGGSGGPAPEDTSKLSGRGAFPKSARVLQRREFDKIHQRGVRVHGPDFTVVACRSVDPAAKGARFGCAVSRKVGNAVVRNRLKRLMREVFRQCRWSLPKVDLVVILRPAAAARARGGLDDLARDLIPAFERASREALSGARSRGRRRKSRHKPKDRGRGRSQAVKK